ncbi:MAG: T9SS type A sorting domain-containing protein [Candidatus Kapabacteria bacterium]|nr:T9SS type A sorting domain-containing protein [Candidatus Kapabacteria bacterium]
MKTLFTSFLIFHFIPLISIAQSLQLDWEFTNFDVPRIEYLKGSKIKTTLDDRIFVSCESQTTYPFFLILNNDGGYEVHKDIDWSYLSSEHLHNYLEHNNVNKLDIGEGTETYYIHNVWVDKKRSIKRTMIMSLTKEGYIPVRSNLSTYPPSFKNVSSVHLFSGSAFYIANSKYQILDDSILINPYIELCISIDGYPYASKEFTPITTTPNVKIEPVIFQRVKDSNFVYVMSPTKESAYTPLGFSVRFLEQRWHNEVVVDISKSQLGIPTTDMIEATSMDWNQDFIAISGNWYKANGEKQEFVFVIDYEGKIRSVQILDETIHCNQVRFSEKGFLVLAGNKKLGSETQQHYVGVYNDRLEFVTDKTWGDSTENALRDITRAKNANAVVVTGWSGNSVYVAQLDLHSFTNVAEQQFTHSISLHPNPANGTVSIQWNSPFNNHYDISILDYIGRTVLEKQQITSNITLSTGHLPIGLYHVIIRRGSNRYSKMLSIVR